MEESEKKSVSTPVAVVLIAVTVLVLFGFLYARFIYQPTISPEQTRANMQRSQQQQMQQRYQQQGQPGTR